MSDYTRSDLERYEDEFRQGFENTSREELVERAGECLKDLFEKHNLSAYYLIEDVLWLWHNITFEEIGTSRGEYMRLHRQALLEEAKRDWAFLGMLLANPLGTKFDRAAFSAPIKAIKQHLAQANAEPWEIAAGLTYAELNALEQRYRPEDGSLMDLDDPHVIEAILSVGDEVWH